MAVSLERYLHPYYLTNAALVGSYGILKSHYENNGFTSHSKYLEESTLTYWVSPLERQWNLSLFPFHLRVLMDIAIGVCVPKSLEDGCFSLNLVAGGASATWLPPGCQVPKHQVFTDCKIFTVAQESQAFAALAVILMLHYFFRYKSLDGFLSNVFFYSKAILVTLAYIIDKRVFWWYGLAVGVAHLLLPQPRQEYIPAVEVLTASGMKEKVLQKDSKTNWLVVCNTSWSAECTHYAPILSELAAEFSSDTLKFGSLDVGTWGTWAAKQLKLEVNASSTHLPTWIMFENGAELGRFPRTDSDQKRPCYKKKDLVKFFLLNSQAAGKQATGGSSGSGKHSRKK